jgi:hypothetical protein
LKGQGARSYVAEGSDVGTTAAVGSCGVLVGISEGVAVPQADRIVLISTVVIIHLSTVLLASNIIDLLYYFHLAVDFTYHLQNPHDGGATLAFQVVYLVVYERSFEHVFGLRRKSKAIEDSEFILHYKEIKFSLQ